MRDVFLRAAKGIAMSADEYNKSYYKTHGCCFALRIADATFEEEELFVRIYRPWNKSRYSMWWGGMNKDHQCDYSQQEARVLALLFLHWMTR